MSVRIDSTLQTYLAAVTIPGNFEGLPDGDFEVALGSYTSPGTFQAPDAVSINSTVSVTLTGRLGAGKSFDPSAGTYWLWGRATRAPDETLTRGSTRITVVTTGGTPVGPAIKYVQTVNDVAPDADGNVDVAGGGGDVQTVAGVSPDGSGNVPLTAANVGADTASARDAAIAALNLGTASTHPASDFQPTDADLTAIAALSTTTYGRALLTMANAAATRSVVGLDQVDNTSDANKAISTATAAALAAKADLVGGLVPTAQIPALALTTSVVVASQAAMLALTTTQVQPGDLAIRTDGAGTFILTATDPSVLANWTRLNAPTDAVTTVNGQTGTVVLAASDVGAQPVDSDLTAIAALTTTSYGRAFLALADAAAGRSALGLGTLATQSGTFSGTSSGTNTGDQTITLTGDVTGSGSGSFAATLKNTGTAGTYGDATHTVTLTTDAQGRVTAVTTNLITGSSFTRQLKTANYTAVLGDYVAADTTGGTFTVTLPAASGGKGAIALKWVAGTAAPSVAVTGSDHFDTSTGSTGGAFTLLNQTATYDSDGTSIWMVRNSFALSTLDARYLGYGKRFISGQWSCLLPTTGAGTGAQSLVGALSQLCAFPFVIPRSLTFNAWGLHVWGTAVTGATVRGGFYPDNGGTPVGATLFADLGTIALSPNGIESATISQAMTPGLWWFVWVQQGGASVAQTYGGNTVSLLGDGRDVTSAASFDDQFLVSSASTFGSGSLPTTFPALSTTVYPTAPRIVFKAA